jgi:hypothetical protein
MIWLVHYTTIRYELFLQNHKEKMEKNDGTMMMCVMWWRYTPTATSQQTIVVCDVFCDVI